MLIDSGSADAAGRVRIADALAEHVEPIRRIVNEVIEHTTAIYDTRPLTPQGAVDWFAAKARGGFPVLVALDPAGEVLGYAAYGVFNPRQGYAATVEHSLAVAAEHRGRGVGRTLLVALLDRARNSGLHTVVGLIDSENAASRGLHESLGFTHAGTIREAGRKFDRWLDLCYYQALLGS